MNCKMGNTILNIKDLAKIEKNVFYTGHYKFIMKDGSKYTSFITDDVSLLRLENYLHMPYSHVVSDKVKSQISQDNKAGVPIELSEVTFIFSDSQTIHRRPVEIRNTYIKDIIAYHKLMVHRGAFESMITKVLENKEEIYTQEFQDKFNNERDKFLELLKKKTGSFNSKL